MRNNTSMLAMERVVALAAVAAMAGSEASAAPPGAQGGILRVGAREAGGRLLHPTAERGQTAGQTFLERSWVEAAQHDRFSATMHCIVCLTTQYMVVYTALALCRFATDPCGELLEKKYPLQKVLEAAALTVNLAPMLAVLFIGLGMHITWVTNGKEPPPMWLQVCMYICTYGLLLLTTLVFVVPCLTGEPVDVDPKTGHISPRSKTEEYNCAAPAFLVLNTFLLICIYASAISIAYGTLAYQPSPAAWPDGKVPPISPAVVCVVILSCQYFFVYACVHIARAVSRHFPDLATRRLEGVLLMATNSMNFAPMLAVLFVAARMRALQMDPVAGAPQPWAQYCFYVCTIALAAQTLTAVAVPIFLQGKAVPGSVEGDMEYEVGIRFLDVLLVVTRYTIMSCIYLGLSAVILSILVMEHPQGPGHTPPISSALQCVVNLTVQFFFVYLVLWASVVAKELRLDSPRLRATMESAKGTVQFCPMLAILFVSTWTRALQLTDGWGAPQDWAQEGMFAATWAVFIQFVMVFAMPLVTGQVPTVDRDGNVQWEPGSRVCAFVIGTVRWLALILLYGGMALVVTGVLVMTPETANGRGAVPLLGDGKVPGTEARIPGYHGMPEPPGVNDLPGLPGR